MKEIIIEVPDKFGTTLKPEKANSEIKGELVRCKDCKFWKPNTQFCQRLSCSFSVHRTPSEWFCADGEMR